MEAMMQHRHDAWPIHTRHLTCGNQHPSSCPVYQVGEANAKMSLKSREGTLQVASCSYPNPSQPVATLLEPNPIPPGLTFWEPRDDWPKALCKWLTGRPDKFLPGLGLGPGPIASAGC